mmetsp:Transcript_12869/g.17787  ORF Transcript_12869/g.17787 Transcript_12869/m.17787 type:complete len:113 (+) Transcript_12869:69-407(+)
MSAGEKFNDALKLIGLSAEDFEKEVKSGFAEADIDKSGAIDKKELTPIVQKIMDAMMAMGERFTADEKKNAVADVMKIVDEDKNGTLNMAEFADAMKLGVLALASVMASKQH